MASLDAARVVVVDESGSNLALTPLYARARKGQRAYGSVPRNYGKNTTLIGALTLAGMSAPMLLEGAVDTVAFEVYVAQVLGPTLTPGQIVLMDNLSSHKGSAVRTLIEARGCELRFLPSYSPDFSPIEHAFSKIKQYLRRTGARTRETLEAAMARAIDTVTSSDAQGYFRHCGYPTPAQPL
jgi:transposase